jgi:predicted NBD/HSP70 family sugar kinase
MRVLGYDVGGTKIEAAIFEIKTDAQSGTPQALRLGTARLPTERAKGYEHIVGQMAALAKELVAQTGLSLSDLQGIGMGLPGAVDPRSRVMLNGNTLVLVGRPIADDLGQALGWKQPIAMGNDANCFALAEHYCGAGLEYARKSGRSPSRSSSIGVILGTGCGGGFVIEGRLLTGAHGGAAEIGHTVLHRGGHACYCGARGCAEQYLSGTGIEGHYSSRRYGQVKDVHTAREIFEQAQLGEPLAVAVIKAYVHDLTLFLAGLTNTLNPDFFVLGGGVSLQDQIYGGLEQGVLGHAFLPLKELPIYKHRLSDAAGALGAALLPIAHEFERQNLP